MCAQSNSEKLTGHGRTVGKSRPRLNWEKIREALPLSECEAKVYLSLVVTGSSTARYLGMTAGVPRTKIRSVLRNLMEMGLVTETPGEPRRFLPNPPEKALRSYLEEQEKKASDLYSFISSLEESCNDEVKGSASEPSRVWVLRGKKMILEKTRQLLSGADKSVQIETDTEGSVMFFELFREQLESLKEKLVKIRLIAPLNPTNRYALCQLEYACEVVESSVPWPIIHLTVDSRHFLLAFMEPSVFIPHLESEIAIYSENPVLARIFEVLLSRRAKWSTS